MIQIEMLAEEDKVDGDGSGSFHRYTKPMLPASLHLFISSSLPLSILIIIIIIDELTYVFLLYYTHSLHTPVQQTFEV